MDWETFLKQLAGGLVQQAQEASPLLKDFPKTPKQSTRSPAPEIKVTAKAPRTKLEKDIAESQLKEHDGAREVFPLHHAFEAITGSIDPLKRIDALAKPLAAGLNVRGIGKERLKNSPLLRPPNIDFQDLKKLLGEKLREAAKTPHPLRGVKEEIPFQHASGKLFDHPSVAEEVMGKGAGDQWQGTGWYNTGTRGFENDVAREGLTPIQKFYKDLISGQHATNAYVLPGSGAHLSVKALDDLLESFRVLTHRTHPIADRFASKLKGEAQRLYAGKDYKDYTRLVKQFLEEKKFFDDMVKKVKNGTATLDDFPEGSVGRYYFKAGNRDELVDYLRGRSSEVKRSVRDNMNNRDEADAILSNSIRYDGTVNYPGPTAIYSGKFYANPDELFDIQKSIFDQPGRARIQGALNEFSAWNPSTDQIVGVGDDLIRRQAGKDPSVIYDTNESLLRYGFTDYTPGGNQLSNVTPRQVMEALRSRGIQGNSYLTRVAKENPNIPQTRNYVVTNPDRVQLTDVWQAFLAALGGGAATLAAQNKPDKDL